MQSKHGGAAVEKLEVLPESRTDAKPNLRGDRANFCLLMLLFVMQGVTFGFTVMALPVILQSKKTVTYEDQALFSLTQWPNSMKLIWAPIVDAVYVKWIGRRKSWLHPVQFLEGAILIYLANNINDWLPESGEPNILVLTAVFFVLNFLSSTENIVIDGWALTILRKSNLGYSSASSSSGFALGTMLGSTVPVLITSEEFTVNYLRMTHVTGSIITLERFLFIWGIMIMLITTLICIFKKEKDQRLEDNHVQLSIAQSYKLLWDILKLPNIRVLLIALITMKIGFSAIRPALTNFKLIDSGVPKDDLMILGTAMFLVKIVTPLAVSKYTSGPKPMSICLNTTPVRLFWSLTYISFVYFTPMLINQNGVINIPIYYYLTLGFLNAVNEALGYIMIVATASFFSRISDPRFGGTYMTLLFTISNLGMVWSSSLGLQMLEHLTFKKCSNNHNNNCSTTDLTNTCYLNKGKCVTILDGYYVEIVICVIIGFVWYGVFKNILKSFQTKSTSHWMVYTNDHSKMTDNHSNNLNSK